MASGKEERERRRAERLAAEERESGAQRRRMLAGYVVAGALALAVVVGLVIVLASGDDDGDVQSGDFSENAHVQAQSGSVNDVPVDEREGTPPPPLEQGDLEQAAKAADCELRLDLPDEGSSHIEPSDDEPKYKTSPPTSGDHSVPQQADGAYLENPGNIFVIHSMEHGRVNLQYSPDLPEPEQLELKGVFDEDPAGMLFFPNDAMPHAVAVTAWTQLMSCDTYEGQATLDAVRDFRDIYRGQGPEDVPIVTG